MALISRVRALTFFSIAVRLASSSAATRRRVFPGDLARTHAGEDCLCLPGGDVLLRPTGGELGEQSLQPVHGRHPLIRQLVAVVDEHPQRLELAVGREDAQVLGADGGDRDRVRVVGVGLAAMAGVQQTCPGCELGGDVDDALAGLQQPLSQRATHPEAALDCPLSVRPLLHVFAHGREAGLVGSKPARSQDVLLLIDDLDRGRQLVGIDPDDNSPHGCTRALPWMDGTARWASLLRAGQSPLEPRLVTAPDGPQTGIEPHPQAGWAAQN
jgi:hypothetical protein